MELLLPVLIVAVWLILSHIRKQQFLKDYMALQHKALDKGVALPGDLNEIASAKTDWAAVTLRVGIISLVLGITGVIIGMYLLPSRLGASRDTDTAAILILFWSMGLLLAAFGLGSLICWLTIDRRRAGKTGRGEQA